MLKQLRELTGYGFGGGLAFVITTAALLLAERAHWPHLAAAIVAYTIGFLVNFLFQILVTFRSANNRVASRLLRFALIQVLGFLLFIGLIAFLVRILGLHYFVAYLTTVVVTFALNFVLSKRFAFAPTLNTRSGLSPGEPTSSKLWNSTK